MQDVSMDKGFTFTVLNHCPQPFGVYDWHKPDYGYKGILHVENVYLGSLAVLDAVRQEAERVSNDCVDVLYPSPFPFWGSYPEIMAHQKALIQQFVDSARAVGRRAILGFSVWQGKQALDVLELLRFTRDYSRGDAVTVLGGPGLNVSDPLLVARLFESGGDIVNIGGAREIASWIARLEPQISFERDEGGNLLTSIPDGAPFLTRRTKNSLHSTGSSVDPPPAYFFWRDEVQVHVPGSGCDFGCGYCNIGPHHRNERRTGEARAFAARVQATVEAAFRETRRPSPGGLLHLRVNNPNPLQTTFFRDFLEKMDWSRIGSIAFMGNVMDFRTDQGMEGHLHMIEWLLGRHPDLKCSVGLFRDARAKEHDGRFLGRGMVSRGLNEEEFNAIDRNFWRFVSEIARRGWAGRVSFTTAYLLNPDMPPALYLQRLDDLFSCAETGAPLFAGGNLEPVAPFTGTAVAAENSGHFAPLIAMEEDWFGEHEISGMRLSSWANQYLNGDLLDCVTAVRFMARYVDSWYSTSFLEPLLIAWDGGALDPAKFDDPAKQKTVESVTKAEGPRIIPLLGAFVRRFLEQQKSKDSLEEEDLRHLQRLHGLIDWIYRRETWLHENSLHYRGNEKCERVIAWTDETGAALGRTVKQAEPIMAAFLAQRLQTMRTEVPAAPAALSVPTL